MELKIYNPQEGGFLKAIEWNYEELKSDIQALIKDRAYDTIVYSDEQIKEAKADRAKLNKLSNALDSERKRIKTECMKPYTDFEKQIKELLGIIGTATENIDSQIKGYEEHQREEKKVKVHELYEEIVPDELRDFLPFEVVLIDKYLNAGTTMKAVKEGITAITERTKADLDVISNLPEYVFEATQRYKKTLNITHCLAYANELREEAEKKRIFEEQCRQAEAERQERLKHEAECLKNANRGFVARDEVSSNHEPAAQAQLKAPEPEERRMTIQFKVTAKESQFEAVNRILAELKVACEVFEMMK